MVISAYSRQTRSAMGGELDHKEREVTSHGGDFRWSSEKSGTHQRQIQHTSKSRTGTTSPPATPANSGAQSWEAPGVDHFEEPALPTEELRNHNPKEDTLPETGMHQ